MSDVKVMAFFPLGHMLHLPQISSQLNSNKPTTALDKTWSIFDQRKPDLTKTEPTPQSSVLYLIYLQQYYYN